MNPPAPPPRKEIKEPHLPLTVGVGETTSLGPVSTPCGRPEICAGLYDTDANPTWWCPRCGAFMESARGETLR